MKIIKRDFAGHTVQPVDFIEEGTVDKERSTLSGASASLQILTGAYEGLEVTDSNGVTLILRTDTVTSTQILPAAAVPFAGTTQDLKDLLKEFFFFDIGASSGAGGNIFDQFGSLGNYFQTQSFKGSTILTSSIHNPAFQYAIPIYMGGTYTELSIIKLVYAFTWLMNYALYDSRTGAGVPGYPNNKIFQSSEIALGTPQQFVQTLLSPSLVLQPGIYWFSWAANGAFTWKGLG